MDLQPGMMVTDSVRLHRQIGEGGMGTIWVAEHLSLETEVAVKFMAPELATHPDAVARFTREAKAAARLRSPHVVKVFDHGLVDGGVPYMTMELLEGENLEARVSRAGRLRMEETVQVVTQLAKALAEAHAIGVIHRDVKPDNVFLMDCNGDFFVKVLDFGIAKHATGKASLGVTNSGTTIGTPIYMSPEQILSAKDVDYRCDLWSLAVVAYYCLTGRVPFEGETFGAVCIAIDRGRMRLPSALRGEVPAAIDAWFAKALARDVDARFRSAREMADAFVTAMSGAAPSRSISFALTVPLFARKPAYAARRTLQRTMAGGLISATAGRSARKHATTAVSVAAMMILAFCSMTLGRVWFGRDGATPVLQASPSLAYAETAAARPEPPHFVALAIDAARAAKVEGRIREPQTTAPSDLAAGATVMVTSRPSVRPPSSWKSAPPAPRAPTLVATTKPGAPDDERTDVEAASATEADAVDAPEHTRPAVDSETDAGTHDAGPPTMVDPKPLTSPGARGGDTPVL